MFNITLNEFKSWNKLSLNFPLTGITLLKGQSGVGKSTIMEAIYWTLYGTVKQITPHKPSAKEKTFVELSFENIMIRRSKNPNKLFFSKNSVMYEDVAAQEMINKEYGSQYVWLSTSYIPQGNRNLFIGSNNDSKIKILNEITFHDENPEEIIEKINEDFMKQKVKYELKLKDFNSLKNNYDEASQNFDNAKIISQNEYESYSEQFHSLSEELKETEKTLIERDKKLSLIDSLEASLKLNILSEVEEINIEKHNEEIKNLRRDLSINEKVQEYESKLKYLKYDSELSKKYTENSPLEYEELLIQENNYRNYLSDLNNLKIKCFSEIPFLISEYQNKISQNNMIIESIEYFSLMNKYEKHMKEYQELKSVNFTAPNFIENKILNKKFIDCSQLYVEIEKIKDDINKILEKLSLSSEKVNKLKEFRKIKLECPKCNSSLKLVGNQLVKIENMNFSNLDSQIKNAELELSDEKLKLGDEKLKLDRLEKNIRENEILNSREELRYQKELNNENNRKEDFGRKIKEISLQEEKRKIKLEKYEREISLQKESLNKFVGNYSQYKNKTPSNKKEILNYSHLIKKLEEFKEVKKPSSSQNIKEIIRNFEIFKKADEIQQTLNSYQVESYEIITEKIKSLENIIIKFRKDKERNESVKNFRKQTELKIQETLKETPERPSKTLDQISSEIKRISDLVSEAKIQDKYLKFISYYNDYEKYIQDFSQNLNDIQELKRIALETECETLENVVSIINSNLSNISHSLFENECIVNLNLHKETKASKVVKPNVNFAITYKGHKYDQLNYMSGGEVDRVSLAITMGFNILSSFPLLLLDENMDSLDCDTREFAIKTVRKNTNKSVIVIAHDSVEGFFDKIIEL